MIYHIQNENFRNSLSEMTYQISNVKYNDIRIIVSVRVFTEEQTIICHHQVIAECVEDYDCIKLVGDYKHLSITGTTLLGYYQKEPENEVICNRIYFLPLLKEQNPSYIVVIIVGLILICLTLCLWSHLLCKQRFCNQPTDTLRDFRSLRRPTITQTQTHINPVYHHFHVHIHSPSSRIREIEMIQRKSVILRQIPQEEDRFCSITLEIIEPNEQYIHCQECQKNFLSEGFLEWFKINSQCPHCRTMLTQEQIHLFQNQ